MGLSHFRCDIYSKERYSKYTLKAHMNHCLEDTAKKTCAVCSQEFNKKHDLLTHEVKAHGAKHFECQVCHKNLRSVYTLRKHTNLCSNDKPYRTSCNVCFIEFRRKRELLRHEVKVHDLKHFECSVCNKNLSSAMTLKFHMRRYHRKLQQPTQKEEKLEPLFCTYCGRKFSKVRSREDHEKAVHLKIKNFNCQICQRAFFSKKNCEAHEKTHLNIKYFDCKLCSSTFRWKKELRLHEWKKHKITPFQCPHCNKFLTSRVILENHISAVHNSSKPARPFSSSQTSVCSFCFKVFACAANRYRHEQNVHLNIKRFFCMYCDIGFYDKRSCQDHEKTHTKRPKKTKTKSN